MKPSIYNADIYPPIHLAGASETHPVVKNSDLISDYLYSLNYAYKLRIDEYLTMVRTKGRLKAQHLEQNLEVALAYMSIINKWLYPTLDADENFMSLADMVAIEVRLNQLLETSVCLFQLPQAVGFI